MRTFHILACLSGVALARCPIRGFREGSVDTVTIFESAGSAVGGARSTVRPKGVEAPEAMPSEGNLYVHALNREVTQKLCFSGAPVGTFDKEMCCPDEGECNLALVSTSSLIPTERKLIEFNNEGKRLSGKVYVKGSECIRPSDNVQRTPEARADSTPDAVPYEFASRTLASACSCHSGRPEFHSTNLPVTSVEAAAWAEKIYTIEGTDLRQRMPDTYKRGCAFFQSGYGWDNNKDKTQVVPIIPVRPLSANVTKVNASHVGVPIFGFNQEKLAQKLKCSGDATLQEDVNFCVFGTTSNEARVVRGTDLTDLSDFCSLPAGDTGNSERRARCCMTATFTGTAGVNSFTMIRGDVMGAIGCNGANYAINNGDGEFHFAAEFAEPEDDLFAKVHGGREGTLLREVFSDTLSTYRNAEGESGFHRVCVPRLPAGTRPEPMCHRVSEINLAETSANLGELKEEVDAVFNFDIGEGTDYTARLNAILNADRTSYLALSRAWFRSCLLPRIDSFGQPVPTKACDAIGLFNAQPFNTEEICTDDRDVPPLVKGWALSRGVNIKEALKEWSKMPPSFYSAAGSVPLTPADMLSQDRCLAGADARSFPKDRIMPKWMFENRGSTSDDRRPLSDKAREATCSTAANCCTLQTGETIEDTNGDGCAAQCNIFDRHLERVNITLSDEDWATIWKICADFDMKDRFLCRLAGQYYVDRAMFKVDVGGNLSAYAKPADADRHVYCTGTFDRIPGEALPSILEDNDDITFLRAGPRTRGIEHPLWEGGGYVGGADKPSFEFLTEPTEQGQKVPHRMVTPAGKTATPVSGNINHAANNAVDSIAGALVIDTSCYLENHRAAFAEGEEFMSIPGLYPRWLDLNTEPATDCAQFRDDGTKMQEPKSQPFVDLYNRGGGATYAEDMNDFAGYVGSVTGGWDYGNYEVTDGNKYFRPHDNGVCIAPSNNGCAGFCDAGARAGQIASTVGEAVAAIALVAADVLSDGALTPAIAGLETSGAAAATVEATSTAAKAAKMASSGLRNTAKYTLKGARGTLKYGKKGLNFLGLKPKHGLLMGLDVAAKVASGGDPGPKTTGPVAMSQSWRNLIRAEMASDRHPIRQQDTNDPQAKYLELPSMIFTCLDGENGCFRQTTETPQTTKFGAQRSGDRWNYEPAMLPTQTFATQLGCHTAYSNDGTFKLELPDFTDFAQKITFAHRDGDGFPKLRFNVIDSDVVRGMTDNKLYYAGNKTHTYVPIVDASMHGCSLCALYSGYVSTTPRVHQCTLLNDEGTPKFMRYAIDPTTPHDYRGALALSQLDLGSVGRVDLQFVNGGQISTRTWTRGATVEADVKRGIETQRLLGLNLTSLGDRLTRGPCLGDTSSLESKCAFDDALRVHPDNKIDCVDNTTQYAGACINPFWANDERLIMPSSPLFDPRAEKLSYCANRWGSTLDRPFDENYYTEMLGTGPKRPLFNPNVSSFMFCEDDMLSDVERTAFCKGSDSALAGSRAAMGLRPTARFSIDDVCDFSTRRCILYPDDPMGWTFSRTMAELRAQPIDGVFKLVFVPVSFKVLVNIPLFATVVETSWFNNPKDADAFAFFEAAATEPIFRAINVSWAVSRVLAEGFCKAGGPDSENQDLFMALLWAIVENMSVDGKIYSVVSFDSASDTGNGFATQRLDYTEKQVYPDVVESGIATGNQQFLIQSAFDARVGVQAALFAPTLEGRFLAAKPVKFAGKPLVGADTCTRFFAQAPIVLKNVVFYQDAPGCVKLDTNDRAPVVAFGQSVRKTIFDSTECYGCPVHGLLARGFDTTQYDGKIALAANLDVDGTAMVATTLQLHWQDCDDTVTALECAGLDYFSGVSLALARTQGNAEVVSCPAAATNVRCYAETERTAPFLVVVDDAGFPMRSWASGQRPTSCDSTCNANDHPGPYCYQAYQWECGQQGNWTTERIFDAENVFGTGDGRLLEGECTQEIEGVLTPLLTGTLLQNRTDLLPPWVGWPGSTAVNVVNNPALSGTTILVDHDPTLRRGDRFHFGCYQTCAELTNSTSCNLANECSISGDACIFTSNETTTLNQTGCDDVYFVRTYTFPQATGQPGSLTISATLDGEALEFGGVNPVTPVLSGTPLISERLLLNEPCAPEDFALMSDGAMFVEDDVAGQLVRYETAVVLTHKCSSIGCPGAINATGDVPVCNTALDSVDGEGNFMWHTYADIPNAPIFSMPHRQNPGYAALPFYVEFSSDPTAFGVALRQLHSVNRSGYCLDRVGSRLETRECRTGVFSQLFLLVPDGPFARIEVPDDPYMCIYARNSNEDAVLVPCPPCFVGAGPHVVNLPDLTRSSIPRVDFAPENGASTGQPGTMLIPLGTDAHYGLSVNLSTGLCLCAASTQIGSYTCPCNLASRRVRDLGVDCDSAAGMLLAACGKLGAGMAAVNGYKNNMKTACAKLVPGKRYSGKFRGRGALLACNADGDMVRVLDPGANFADKEPIEELDGLLAVVTKVVLQPEQSGMPSIVIAPYALEINATSFLEPFGTHLHTLAVQGFRSGPVMWAGVIAELTVIFVAVLVQCCLYRDPLKVQDAYQAQKLEKKQQ